MSRRARNPRRIAPLPQRRGLDPVRLVLPEQFPAELSSSNPQQARVADYLIGRFYPQDPQAVYDRFTAGEVTDDAGKKLTLETPFQAKLAIWYYRDPGLEPELPSDLPVLYQDPWILAVDKPHFLPTTPRGMFAAQTALTKLRIREDNPQLSPVHRLDRATAGVLVFAKVPEARGPFQILFQERKVSKTYQALAPLIPGISPGQKIEVESYIHKQRGIAQVKQLSLSQCQRQGLIPNAKTQILLLGTVTVPQSFPQVSNKNPLLSLPKPGSIWGHYRLLPYTGKTHQLRAHLNLLQAPILGDVLYPVAANQADDEPLLPLQLLADSLTFRHPFTGSVTRIVGKRKLLLTSS